MKNIPPARKQTIKERIVRSTKEEQGLIVNAAVVEFVTGSGRKAIIDIDNDLLCKRAIVKIRNTDYSCLPRAIVVGYKHLMTKLNKDQESLKVYNRIYSQVLWFIHTVRS